MDYTILRSVDKMVINRLHIKLRNRDNNVIDYLQNRAYAKI